MGVVVFTALALILPFSIKNNSRYVAYADSVITDYTFYGSNNVQINSIISLQSDLRESLPLDVRFDLASDYTNGLVRIYGHCNYYTGTSPLTLHTLNFVGSNGSIIATPTFSYNYGETIYLASSTSEFLNYGGFPCHIFVSGSFNSDVYKIELGSGSFHYLSYGSSSIKAFYIKYYDVNDNYVYFEFVIPSNIDYNVRTYYLVSPDDFTDQQIYQNGYQAGLDANQDNIYQDGYSAGNTYGYGIGYQAGLESANTNTFTSLISAVIDVPVRAFTSLFNFDLLGINLATFFGSLLSVAVIIAIIKAII